MKKTNDLLLALSSAPDNPGAFLSFITRHKAKNDPFDFAELLQVFTKKDLLKLWEVGAAAVRKSLDKIKSVANQLSDEEANNLLELLDGILIMVNCYLSLDRVHVVKELHQIILYLHDSLLAIPDLDIQDNISQACEKWWSRDLADKGLLVANSITYLITRAVSDIATVSVIKRLYAMKDAMQILEFDDPSSEALKAVLLQCYVTPIFLKADQGRKFLSSLFYLSLSYTAQIHESIKMLLLHCPSQHLTWYGNIYFDAWKNAMTPYLEVIENQCLQDLMYSAVHAPRKGTRSMFHSLRCVLACFHQRVTQQNVINMLVRLYGPFLWRSLKVANADVRTNATTLLLEVFPLQDHCQNKQDQDEGLQRQFTIMKELLEDPSVAVRIAAITGVCRVLSYYWELVPASVIKSFLTKLIVKLCRDASSDNVRVAVLQGMCVIMDNVLSVPVMKELLPLLHHCIHDTSEKVRIAFCELLLVVKGMKSIKFWNVCPMEDLMTRMECDTAHVAKRIVALVIDSFQGTKVDLSQQVDRCIYLLQVYPEAARRFYQLAQSHLSSANAAQLILAINQFFIHVIEHGADAPSCQQQNGDDNDMENGDGDMENGDSENESMNTVTVNDTSIICGLLETMAILWEGNRQQFDKPACKAIKNQLVSKLATSHFKFYHTFPDNSCQAAIFLLASHLPKRHVKLPMDVSKLPREQAIAMLLALASWKQTDVVLEQISDCLDCSTKLGGAVASLKAPPKRRGRKAKAASTEPPAAKDGGADVTRPQVALEQLEWLMTYPVSCKTVKSSKMFTTLKQCLQRSMDLIEQRCTDVASDAVVAMDTLLVQMFTVYVKMLMHSCLETGDGNDFKQSIEKIWHWFDQALLPATDHSPGVVGMATRHGRKRSKGQSSSIPIEVLKAFLCLLREMILIGLADRADLCNLIGKIIMGVADKCVAPEVWLQLCKLLYQLVESCSIQEEGLMKTTSLEPLPPALEKILATLLTTTDTVKYNKVIY